MFKHWLDILPLDSPKPFNFIGDSKGFHARISEKSARSCPLHLCDNETSVHCLGIVLSISSRIAHNFSFFS